MQVSQKLGLEPMPKGASVSQRRRLYRERVEHLKRVLKRGHMSPKLTQRCEEYIRAFEYRIRQLDKRNADPAKVRDIRPVETKRKPLPQVERQGVLPNFLSQLNNARVEELVAERIFQRLSLAIDKAMDNVFKKAASNE